MDYNEFPLLCTFTGMPSQHYRHTLWTLQRWLLWECPKWTSRCLSSLFMSVGG